MSNNVLMGVYNPTNKHVQYISFQSCFEIDNGHTGKMLLQYHGSYEHALELIKKGNLISAVAEAETNFIDTHQFKELSKQYNSAYLFLYNTWFFVHKGKSTALSLDYINLHKSENLAPNILEKRL